MTVTKLDPASALLIIDLQNGIVAGPKAHPVEQIVTNATKLAEAFRLHGLPVVIVNVKGRPPGRTERPASTAAQPDDWADLVPELNIQSTDILITKHQWGAFHDTGLNERLKNLNITQIVLAGIATSMGVESTARAAYEHGYNVALATDAMTDFDQESHDNSIKNVFPKIGECGTTAEIISLLDKLN